MENETKELLKKLAMEAKELGFAKEEKEEDKPKVRKQSDIILSLAEYPDIILTRKTARQIKHLIIMPSAGALFFKFEQNGKEETIPFSPEEYTKFFSASCELYLPNGFWTEKFEKGIENGRRLDEIFKSQTILEMIRKKCFPLGIDLMEPKKKYQVAEYEKYVNAYKTIPELYIEFRDEKKSFEAIIYNNDFIKGIVDTFGLENGRDFMRTYNQSLIYFDKNDRRMLMRRRSYAFEKIAAESFMPFIPRIPLKYKSFRDYILYDAVSMGYRRCYQTFFIEWFDSMEIEYLIYGKIKNKYPKNLPTHHNILSDKKYLMNEKIDEQRLLLRAEEAMKYAGTYKDYVFIVPDKKQDFLDEAAMQGNCLAGYIKIVVDGYFSIIFMRKKTDPENSYITVEIINGQAAQAKLARNDTPCYKDLEILNEWINKCNKGENLN